jgi:hypothetical protein
MNDGRTLTVGCYAASCVRVTGVWYLYIWHTVSMKTLGKAIVLRGEE